MHSLASICNQRRDFRSNSGKQYSDHTFNYNSESHSLPPSFQKSLLSLAIGHSRQKVIPIPIPMRNLQQVYNSMDQNLNTASKQADNYQRHKLNFSENGMHISSATNQSASGKFCGDNVGNRNNFACGNKGCVDRTAGGGSVVESGNEGSSAFDTIYQRNVQREAALNKFRLKRKERCFEKKVRYKSRKKLAEQRPLVNGQVVRPS